ncbi:MAG TPA: tRNA (guanosine(37)-N1)-methyltransferase TrmD, partial [Candidatus Cloacimonetes bacterium]|nr:tRNA (guanosine(37)-N1)-methyltransferase TrmD [Candidatus Cloacimonadota bacterium]
DIDSALSDSFQKRVLGCPYYTRPADFRGIKVPDVLISGDHKKIEEWRKQKSLELTKRIRPELIKDKDS